MLKAIAEFQVIERIDGKTYPMKMNIFDEKDRIKIIRMVEGKKTTICDCTADEFLKRTAWNFAFLDSKKIDKMKNWRR